MSGFVGAIIGMIGTILGTWYNNRYILKKEHVKYIREFFGEFLAEISTLNRSRVYSDGLPKKSGYNLNIILKTSNPETENIINIYKDIVESLRIAEGFSNPNLAYGVIKFAPQIVAAEINARKLEELIEKYIAYEENKL
jgi:hypothetical protein